MNETIMVRSDLDVIELTQSRHLTAFGESTEHGDIKLQDLNGLLFEKRAAAIRGDFTFSGRQGNLRALGQKFQLPAIIDPANRFFKPTGT